MSTREHNLTCHTHSITPIIICRFTLDLRQVKLPGSSWVSGNQSASLRFVGNAGGSLRFGPDEDEEGEENAGGEHLSQAGISGISVAGKEEHGGTARNDYASELVSVRTWMKGQWITAGTPHVVIQSAVLIKKILISLGF